MGRRLRVVEHPLESGAMGVALPVAVGISVSPNKDAIDELIHIDHTVEPHPGLERRYDRMYADYRQAYEALAPVFRRMHTTP